MFVDASAWTTILLSEPEAETFRLKLTDAEIVMTSAMATWETIRAVGREAVGDFREVTDSVVALQKLAAARIISIGEAEQEAAIEAHVRFGKGRHPAKLNMGDCFAYACARTHGMPLLYKGDDFALTDIEPA